MSEKKFDVIVVDDDKFQLEIISGFVKKTPFLELIGAYNHPVEALDKIISDSPDLILIDVEMPELSGLELLKSLKNPPKTVVITGKKEYAVEAFDLDVVDYLVKPVDSYARFLKAVTKAKESIPAKDKAEIEDCIYIREDSLLVSVQLSDILYFEASGDYVKIGTTEKVRITHSTLSKIEKRLPERFFKVHRSYIVNLDKIKNIDQTNLQVGEKIIPISQSMRPKLMSRIDTF